MRLSINYSYLTLMSIMAGILIACHWAACIFGLTASFDPLGSWPYGIEYCVEWGHPNKSVAESMLDTACPSDWHCDIGICNSQNFCRNGYACAHPLDMYSMSLYFVVMTITSVGYGDVTATKFNVGEQFVFVVIMLITGMLWGYLIGIFCTMASPSPEVQDFRSDLSSLNEFMASHKVASASRYRLREYMHQTVHLKTIEGRQKLLSKLSPSMQGEMALLINERTIHRVWYLADVEMGLLIDISAKLTPLVFPPAEYCPPRFLYIINKGIAIYAGKMRHNGNTWGDDVILNRPDLQLDFPAVPISYLWVYTVSGEDLNASIDKFPASKAALERVKRRWIIRRALVRAAERACYDRHEHFRGRSLPILAKDITLLIMKGRQRNAGRAAAERLDNAIRSDSTNAVQARRHFFMHITGNNSGQSGMNQTATRAKARDAAHSAAAEYGMQLRLLLMEARKAERGNAVAALKQDVANLQVTTTKLEAEMSELRSDVKSILDLLKDERKQIADTDGDAHFDA